MFQVTQYIKNMFDPASVSISSHTFLNHLCPLWLEITFPFPTI